MKNKKRLALSLTEKDIELLKLVADKYCKLGFIKNATMSEYLAWSLPRSYHNAEEFEKKRADEERKKFMINEEQS